MEKYAFLNWAADVANTDFQDIERLVTLIAGGLENKFFDEIEGTQKRSWKFIDYPTLAKSLTDLKDNVEAFIRAVDTGNPFSLRIEGRSDAEMLIDPDKIETRNHQVQGRVLYSYKRTTEIDRDEREKIKAHFETLADAMHRNGSSRDRRELVQQGVAQWESEQKALPGMEGFDLNPLVLRFYKEIEAYCMAKKCGFADIPLRRCPQCEQVFFGRLKKQRFCSRSHNTIWTAKQKYHENKKGGAK